MSLCKDINLLNLLKVLYRVTLCMQSILKSSFQETNKEVIKANDKEEKAITDTESKNALQVSDSCK